MRQDTHVRTTAKRMDAEQARRMHRRLDPEDNSKCPCISDLAERLLAHTQQCAEEDGSNRNAWIRAKLTDEAAWDGMLAANGEVYSAKERALALLWRRQKAEVLGLTTQDLATSEQAKEIVRSWSRCVSRKRPKEEAPARPAARKKAVVAPVSEDDSSESEEVVQGAPLGRHARPRWSEPTMESLDMAQVEPVEIAEVSFLEESELMEQEHETAREYFDFWVKGDKAEVENKEALVGQPGTVWRKRLERSICGAGGFVFCSESGLKEAHKIRRLPSIQSEHVPTITGNCNWLVMEMEQGGDLRIYRPGSWKSYARLMGLNPMSLAWRLTELMSETCARVSIGGGVLIECAAGVFEYGFEASGMRREAQEVKERRALTMIALNAGVGMVVEAAEQAWEAGGDEGYLTIEYSLKCIAMAEASRAIISAMEKEFGYRKQQADMYGDFGATWEPPLVVGSSHLVVDQDKLLALGSPDVIQYSPTCAPLAGTNRLPMDDETRQEDIREMLRQMKSVMHYIEKAQPRLIVIENVATWHTGRFSHLWEEVRRILAFAGSRYEWEADVVDPLAHGGHVARTRCWIVGWSSEGDSD